MKSSKTHFIRGEDEWMALSCPLWFLTGLFCTNILYWFITKINGYRKLFVICGCSILSYCMGYFNFPKLPWNVDTAMMAVVFIAIGDWLYKKENILTLKITEWKIRTITIAVVQICIGFISIYFNHITWVNFMGNQYGNYILMLSGAISMALSLYLLVRILPLNYWGRLSENPKS